MKNSDWTQALRRQLMVAVGALCALWPLAAGAQLWSASTPGTYGSMLALDGAGNAYVSGHVPRSTVLLSKYGPAGNLLWQRTFDNPVTREESTWLTVDAAGQAVVSGRLVNTDGDAHGWVVLKYDAAGTLLWKDVISTPYADTARVLTDAAGNVYVLGRMWLTNSSGITTHDIVTVKYSPGGTRLWVRSFGLDSFSQDSPAALALTPGGHVLVTGGTSGHMLMVAYDGAGNKVWSKAVTANTAGLDVAVGAGGEFYVVGGTWTWATGQVFLVVKHDADFNEVWRKTYAVGHYGLRAVVDSLGNLVVTGIKGSTFDWATVKLDPAGTQLWARTYDQHAYNDEVPYFITLMPDDSVLIAGQGGPAPQSATGDLSLLATVAVRYKADGTQNWSRTSAEGVRGLAVKADATGHVFVLGQSPQVLHAYGQDLSMNLQPVVAASATPTAGTAPLEVRFSSAGSADPDGFGAPLRFWWNFGDGQVSTEANPVHVYAPGSYLARLTVTDRNGAAETSPPIAVSAAAPLPTPSSLSVASFVRGGSRTTATVTVSSDGGVTVALASSNPAVASVPASVTVPAGKTQASFTVKTARVKADTPVTLRATANGGTVSTTLTVTRR